VDADISVADVDKLVAVELSGAVKVPVAVEESPELVKVREISVKDEFEVSVTEAELVLAVPVIVALSVPPVKTLVIVALVLESPVEVAPPKMDERKSLLDIGVCVAEAKSVEVVDSVPLESVAVALKSVVAVAVVPLSAPVAAAEEESLVVKRPTKRPLSLEVAVVDALETVPVAVVKELK
jgi:hypothetical protein